MAVVRYMLSNENGQMTRRLLALWDGADSTQMGYGLDWYSTAHTFCVGMAERHGITVQAAAGVVAALSPRVEWGLNQRMADTLCATGTVGGLKGNVRKAQRCLGGEDPTSVLGGDKVRSFYDNIVRPHTSQTVTIDRHAIDALFGYEGDDITRKVLERVGVYEAASTVYRRAAHKRGVPAHVMQAVCWVTWRDMKRQVA